MTQLHSLISVALLIFGVGLLAGGVAVGVEAKQLKNIAEGLLSCGLAIAGGLSILAGAVLGAAQRSSPP